MSLGALAIDVSGLPSWAPVLVACLCRQRARQTWLMGVSARIGRQDGAVPGEDGWVAFHHGKGLCLRGPGDEIVDMDFDPESPRSIDPWFFAHRVESMRAPDALEVALRRWLPTSALVVAALDDLRARDIVEHPGSSHTFLLCDELERAHVAIAHSTGPDVAPLAESEVEAHRGWLRNVVARRTRSAAISGVAVVWPEGIAGLAREHATLPDSTSAALLYECTRRGLAVTDTAAALCALLDSARHHPGVACAVGEHLLSVPSSASERARALDVLRAFARVERVEGYLANPILDRFAFLFLEHAPEEAMPLVRRALRASPACAESMAELLVAIDESWCHAEIERALREPDLDSWNRRRLVRALAASASDVARRRAVALSPDAPEHDATLPGFSFDEVDHATLSDTTFEIPEATRALAARLRARE